MKVLLDTNIIIHRERIQPLERDIGKLFFWLDKLGCKKYVHQVTIDEIGKMQNAKRLEAFAIKLESYNLLPTTEKLNPALIKIMEKFDKNENDKNDSILLNEIFCGHLDTLITEDRNIHTKARQLGIESRVFTIESFLEKSMAENPDLIDYKVPTIKREYFGDIDVGEVFFDSFREDYDEFDKWFAKKSDETAYICHQEGKIVAFLYLKIEDENEPYPEIQPTFERKKRLKVGTFKVELNGYKLGERFIKIIFDNSLLLNVEEIYLTIFQKRVEHEMLEALIGDYGFKEHGTKISSSGEEVVYVRECQTKANRENPKSAFPYMSKNAEKYIVAIYPEYHTNLFPDSILNTESPLDFIENEPFRNAISKVYISRSFERDLKSGDIIVFYRTGGYYKSVVTTLGIVENVHTQINDFNHFASLCKKRSVFSEEELKLHWDYNIRNRPFIVNFLYAYSFPSRVNMKKLIELGVIKDVESAPRGFKKLTEAQFNAIITETGSNANIVVD
ncbi:MAG: PIN domain-containing protein [Thermoplasmata archaeon]|nr:PIN domain-containing protein [Thermoplasmata archaeon]